MSGTGEPDGVARFTDYPDGEQTITLEAKSSKKAPSAKDIDFAAIQIHMQKYGASGCLLVAPNYQGDEDGNASLSADNLRISCWTVEDLAAVVLAAANRQLSARQVLDIIRTQFAPANVHAAVAVLLADPNWEPRSLYVAVVDALLETRDMLPDSHRNVHMIATHIAGRPDFKGITAARVRQAISEIAGASQGALVLQDSGDIILNVDHEEMERRLESLTGTKASSRRRGTFA